MNFKFILLLISIVALSSCGNEIEEFDQSVFGYEYFPIVKGKYRIYKSDSIIYTGGGTRIDTFSAYIKEEVGEKFMDLEGNSVFKLDRYFKRNLSDNWTKTNTWTSYLGQTKAVTVEENLKFVKLVFPPTKGKSWNGNIFLDTDIRVDVSGEPIQIFRNWNHRVEDTDFSITLANHSFDVLAIRLVDASTIIDRRYVYEYYAKGIGLVKKEMIILDGDGTGINLPWEQKAKKGFIHNLSLIEHN